MNFGLLNKGNSIYISSCIVFLVIILLLFTKDLIISFQENILSGIDGYYYLIQVESIVKQKQFYFSTKTPLILYIFVLAENLINNTVLSIKLGTLILNFLLLMGISTVVFECTRSIFYSLLAPFLFSLSGLHLYFLVEYLSQLGGLTFLIWSFFCLIKLAKTHQNVWLLPSILLFVAACFSHRSIIPIAMTIILCITLLFYIISSVSKQNKQHTVYAYSIAGLVLLSPLILKIQPFFSLPLNLKDEITAVPKFPSHFATLPEIIMLLVVAPAFLWLIIYKQSKTNDNNGNFVFGTVAMFTLLVTLNPFINSAAGFVSLGGRLRTLACVQVALLLPALLWLLKDYSKKIFWGVVIFVVPLFLWSFLAPRPHGAQPEYLANRASLIASLKEKDAAIEKQSLIIADHGDQFVATYIIGVPASQNFPKETTAYKTIYWLLRGMPETFVDNSMIPLFTERSGKVTVLVKHNKMWENRLTNSDVRRHLIPANPHLYFYVVQSNVKPKP